MRVIKFRGKNHETGQWFYGHYTEGSWIDPTDGTEVKRHIIHGEDGFLHDIDPETLGQFTGLYNKNGKGIYEGDILKVTFTNGKPIYKLVKFHSDKAAFCMANNSDLQHEGWLDIWSNISREWVHSMRATVAGNIYDNPQLIKEAEK